MVIILLVIVVTLGIGLTFFLIGAGRPKGAGLLIETNPVSSVFINGELSGTGGIVANGGNGNNLDVIVGGYSKIDADFWDGRIDELIIFNRSLTSSEISDLYNSYNQL